jgi:surfeit locus 1 family protein
MIGRKTRATLVALPLLAILIGLGCWQLHRLAWKEDLLHRLQAGIDAPATLYQGRPVSEFQHLTVEGRLQADQPLYLYARTKDGVAGVHVFAVLERDGAPLLVDRGFVPSSTNGPIDAKLATAPASQNKVTGVVRRQAAKLWYEPANDAARNQWYWPDLPAMADAQHLPMPLDFYLEATEPTAATGPEPTGQLIIGHITNNHLQYAITWFALAGVLVIIWGISLLPKRG